MQNLGVYWQDSAGWWCFPMHEGDTEWDHDADALMRIQLPDDMTPLDLTREDVYRMIDHLVEAAGDTIKAPRVVG